MTTTATTLADGILYLRLAGDLIGSPDTDPLVQLVNAHLAEAAHLGETTPYGILDLSEVRYLNSTGLGALVSLLTKFRSRGGELILVNPAEHPRKLLALTKLTNIFAVAPTEAAAHELLAAAP